MKSVFILFFVGLAFQGVSQQIAPSSVNSGGMSVMQGSVKHNFTVGEIVVTNYTTGGNSLGNGFTNSAGITTQVTALQETNIKELKILVYPNPSTDLLKVEVLESKSDYIMISVYDMTGKLIYSGRYSAFNNTIVLNTSDWSVGCYSLEVRDSKEKNINIYKVIKK